MQILNPSYLQKETLEKVKEAFYSPSSFPSVQLYDFLNADYYSSLRKDILSLPYRHSVKPLQHSYSRASLSPFLRSFFSSAQLSALLSFLFKRKHITAKAYCFSWRDYTLLHDSSWEKPGFDIIFDFTEEWNPSWGGSVLYVDGNGECLKSAPVRNSLLVVKRNRPIQKFVQYLNHFAGAQQRYLVMGTIVS